MNKSTDKGPIPMKRCPRCGSRKIQAESRTTKGIIVVHCADCDSLLRIHDRGTGRTDNRKHHDAEDSETTNQM